MRVRGRTWDHSVFVAVVVGGGSVVGACSGSSTSGAPSGANPSGGAGGVAVAAGGKASAGAPAIAAGSAGTSSTSAGTSSTSAGTSSTRAGAGGFASATAGAPGSINNDPACPASLDDAIVYNVQPECSKEGLSCSLQASCTSGPQAVTVTCQRGLWLPGAVRCDKPYDFCAGSNGFFGPSAYCVDGKWNVERGGKADGQGPCPARPSAGGPCAIGGGTGGGDRKHCGYPCGAESAKWTVLTCVAPGTWSSDGACN